MAFDLSPRGCTVRVDYLGHRCWTGPSVWGGRALTLDPGEVAVHATRAGGDLEGARVYLFDGSGTCQGLVEVAGAHGVARFLLPEGEFRFRVDAAGSQTWTGVHPVAPLVEDVLEANVP